MNKYKRVFVTGGAGCIGIQVCKELVSRGIEVCLFDLPEQVLRVKSDLPARARISFGSILDCSSLKDAMADCDAVIHLAAYLGVYRTEMNRLRCLDINIQGTRNVVDCAVQQRVRKLVFASSSEVYGEPETNPVTESVPTRGKSVYAISKLAGEELCKAYAQRHPDFTYVIVRYFNTYGPYQTAQFVIPRFVKNALEGKPPMINGDGQQIRSYCFSTDTAWATVEVLLRHESDGEVINIGNSHNPTSLIQLAKTVIRLCGKEGELNLRYEPDFNGTDRSRDREVFERFCDTSKAEKLLGFRARVSLEEGLRQVVDQKTIFPDWTTIFGELPVDD